MFCGPCSLLSSSERKDKGLLVNKPYSNWAKISNALSIDSTFLYHRDCVLKADVLMSTCDNPSSCVHVMMSNSLQNRIRENKQIIRQIVRAVLAKQGLPFRGDIERISSVKNPGNFIALLKNYASTDELLFQHLHSPRA